MQGQLQQQQAYIPSSGSPNSPPMNAFTHAARGNVVYQDPPISHEQYNAILKQNLYLQE